MGYPRSASTAAPASAKSETNTAPPRGANGVRQARADRGQQSQDPRAAIAREVAQLLPKVLRALRLYGPTSPAVRRFEEDFLATLGSSLKEGDALSLLATEEALLFGGEPVYTDPDHTEGLPFRLYQTGIRGIAFDPEIEPEEVRLFLSVLRTGMDVRTGDDDLVTLLWQYDLPHIGLLVVDEAPDAAAALQVPMDPVRLGGSTLPGPVTGAVLLKGAKRREERADPFHPAATRPSVFSQELLTCFQAARMAEESQPAGERLADLLLDLAALAEECQDYPAILGLLERAVGAAMGRGDLPWTTRILRELRALAELDGALPPAHREPLHQALARMGEAAATPLGALINKGQVKQVEDLEAFVAVLGDEAIPLLCNALGDLTNRRDRRLLCDIMVRRIGENVDLLARGLADPRWYVVRNVIYILGRTKNPAGVPLLRRVLDHPEPRVVREALRGLDAVGAHKDRAFLTPLLEVRSTPIRMWAIERLAALKDPCVVPKLLPMIQAPDFEERSFEERQRLFEALGRAGTNNLLPMLQKMLIPARIFGRARAQERQRCAIAALGALGTPEARVLLTEGLGSSSDALAANYRAAPAGSPEVPAEPSKEEDS